MLRDRVASVDLFALVPALQLRFEPELAELDRLLEDDELFEHVKGRPESRSAAHDSNGAPIHTGRGHAAAAGGAAPVRLELCPDRALRRRQPGAAPVLPTRVASGAASHDVDALVQPAAARDDASTAGSGD
jgi:hypothetical protein